MELLQQALPAGAFVDHRQAPAASHLRHDDPRQRRPTRSPRHRRPRRVDARMGRRLHLLLDHAVGAGIDRVRAGWRSRRRPTPSRDRRAIGGVVAGHVVGGGGRRGAGRGRGRRPAIRTVRAIGCCRRPSSSNGPANPSTPTAAAAPRPRTRRSRAERVPPVRSVHVSVVHVNSAGRTSRGRCCPGRGTTDPEP